MEAILIPMPHHPLPLSSVIRLSKNVILPYRVGTCINYHTTVVNRPNTLPILSQCFANKISAGSATVGFLLLAAIVDTITLTRTINPLLSGQESLVDEGDMNPSHPFLSISNIYRIIRYGLKLQNYVRFQCRLRMTDFDTPAIINIRYSELGNSPDYNTEDGITNKHPGNQHFRDLIQQVKVKYLACRTNSEKKALSQWVVDDIIKGGGIFLKKLKDEWINASVNEARIKASQGLREGDKIIDQHSACNQEEKKPIMLKKRRSAADNLLYLASNISNKKRKLGHVVLTDARNTEHYAKRIETTNSLSRPKRDIHGNLRYENNPYSSPSARVKSNECDDCGKSDNFSNQLTRNTAQDQNDANICGSTWILKCSDDEHRERFNDYYQISPPSSIFLATEMQNRLKPPNALCLIPPPNEDFNTPQSQPTLTRIGDTWGDSHEKELDLNLNIKHEHGPPLICADDGSDKHKGDSTSLNITFMSTVTNEDIILESKPLKN